MIYFDNAATTFVDNEVLNSFNQAVKNFFANPSSMHQVGYSAALIQKKARQQIANFFKCQEDEVIFTSGATESNNLAIKGYAFRYANRGKHLITCQTEHPSVLNTFKQLQDEFGFQVTYLGVDEYGHVNLDELKDAITDETILVSIMTVNNEVGTIQPVEEIAKLLKNYPKIHFHTDATQAIGKINIDYKDIDMISMSGHKINCFKKSGILIKRKNIDLLPIISGGGQQGNYRSGTEDVPGEIALSKAIRIAFEKQAEHYKQAIKLKERLISKLNEIPNVKINSQNDDSPFIVSIVTNKKGSVVVECLSNKEIYVSTKSACSSKKNEGSNVLRAMNKSEWTVLNSIRISFSYMNTIEEIDIFAKSLKEVLDNIK